MRKSRESQQGLVLEQKLTVWKMSLLQLEEKLPVPCRERLVVGGHGEHRGGGQDRDWGWGCSRWGVVSY